MTRSIHLKTYEKAIYLIIFSALFLLVVYRAQIVSMTHDESLSYELIHGNENITNTANNHWLNTWLMHITSSIFGDSQLSLRLPNILAFLMYLFYCYRLLAPNPFFISLLVGMPLLLINPYMLDFFSMARGYGLSMGFMLGSIYYLFQIKNDNSDFKNLIRNLFASMAMASLALLANFNLLNFFMLLWAILIFRTLYYFYRNRPLRKSELILFLISCLVFGAVLLIAVRRLLFLKDYQQLYHGADSFDYMVFCLGLCSIDLTRYIDDAYNRVVTLVDYMYAIVLAFSIIFYRSRDWRLLQILFIFSFTMVALILEHYLFDALYPMKRTSVYLAPLFGLLLYYFMLNVMNQLKSKFITVSLTVFSSTVLLVMGFNFVTKLTPNQVCEQFLDANIKDAIDHLLSSDEFKNRRTEKVKLAVDWIFLPTCRYYIKMENLPIEAFKIESYDNIQADYIYEFHDKLDKRYVKLMKAFIETPSGLYQCFPKPDGGK